MPKHAEGGGGGEVPVRNKDFQALLDVTSMSAIVAVQAGGVLVCSPLDKECAGSEDLKGEKEERGLPSGKMEHCG